jgi:anaerobic magnesium-protoporphyrin IX monomethyl ester cyclase
MNILLINPPRFNELIGKNPAIIETHRGFNPPLGILSLAGYLQTHTDHNIEILDTQPPNWSYEELSEIIKTKKPDVVGITAMTFTLIDVYKTIEIVKKMHKNTKIILGGAHVHIYPNETITSNLVDYLVLGEGEITFKKLLDNINNKSKLHNLKGLVFKDGDNIINNGISPSTENLDELGIPARNLIDVTNYTSLLGRDNVITTMFTSRGCPFRCTFCDRPFSPVISGFRWRSAKHIADEIEECLQLGIHEAFIYDDTFTVRKDRVFELCEEIKTRKLKFRWDVRAHVNTINLEMLKAMKEAGCDRIHYGVEAGNNRMLKEIKKNTTIEKVKKVFNWTKQVDMEILAYFIIGQQTEKINDIEDSIKLAKELSPNYVHFTIFCPYPATEIYDNGLKNGIIKEDVWKKFATNPTNGWELPVWEENFTRQELRELLVRCYKEFYLRPNYIFKNVMRIKSLGELKRKVKAGISVINMTAGDKVTHKSIQKNVNEIVPNAAYNVYE